MIPMPRYFIDTDDGRLRVQDDEGWEAPDAEAARDMALAALPEMAGDALPDGDRREFAVRWHVAVPLGRERLSPVA